MGCARIFEIVLYLLCPPDCVRKHYVLHLSVLQQSSRNKSNISTVCVWELFPNPPHTAAWNDPSVPLGQAPKLPQHVLSVRRMPVGPVEVLLLHGMRRATGRGGRSAGCAGQVGRGSPGPSPVDNENSLKKFYLMTR